MVEIREIQERDGPELISLRPPVQRAAYSDRTAWQMAVFAELAYLQFESVRPELLEELAGELAQASNAKNIAQRLLSLRELLMTPKKGGEEKLRAALSAAGFELVGTFFNQSLDPLRSTEGFVAKKVEGEGRGFAVLAIRGTTGFQDWKNNANAGLESIGGGRKVHKGFHKAFKDAEDQIEVLLGEVRALPLFVTGHSLGGAVAVMATWYFKRDTLGACYTFGAPRVGNYKFNDAFHTPIYRIVNAFDPVPMVPPTNHVLVPVKFLLRLAARILPFGMFWDFATTWVLRLQGYRHAGDLRHMTEGEMDNNGRYPTVEFYTQYGLVDRVARIWKLATSGQLKRLDTYHHMQTYRRKLRSRALDRAPKSVTWNDEPAAHAVTSVGKGA